MAKQENSGLLIAALVAIVAVVGLVILFKGSATGNAVCPPSQDLQMVTNPDGQNYYACMSHIRDVTVVTRYEPQGTYGPQGSMFPTEAQKKDRDAQIIQRTWNYAAG